MNIKIHIVDAFTLEPGAGNRAGVVLDADGLSVSQMQAIAAFAGYSETAFVLQAKSSDHDLQVRYFTPIMEVPICGHATIAAHFIRARQEQLKQESFQVLTGAGILPVWISGEGPDTKITMQQATPTFGAVLNDSEISMMLKGLGLAPDDLVQGLPAQIVSTGHSKVIIPVRNTAILRKIDLDKDTLTSLSNLISCKGFFPFAVLKNQEEFATQGRMFAPAIGIEEDPITGNANGPAGAYLYHYDVLKLDGELTYSAHQGYEMGKLGTKFVTLNNQGANQLNVKISGNAVSVGTLVFPG